MCLNRLTENVRVCRSSRDGGTLLHPPPEWRRSAPELRPIQRRNQRNRRKTLNNGQVNWITDVGTGQLNEIQKQSNRSAGDNQVQAGTPQVPGPSGRLNRAMWPVRLSASSRTPIKHQRQRSFSGNHASGAYIMLIGAITKIHRYTSAGAAMSTE